MVYSIEKLKELRNLTGAAIKDCIKALNSTDADIVKSIEWLKNYSLVVSKSSRLETSSKKNQFGIVKINIDGNKVVSFCLKCESDFVAMNVNFAKLADEVAVFLLTEFDKLSTFSPEELTAATKDLISRASYTLNETLYIDDIVFFLKNKQDLFGQYIHYNKKVAAFIVLENGNHQTANELALQVVANNPKFLSVEEIPVDVLSKKLAEVKESVENENTSRDSEIVQKIIAGKIDKWFTEVCFFEQHDFRDPSLKIKDKLLSDNVRIKKFAILKITD